MRISNKQILRLAKEAKNNGIKIIQRCTYDSDFNKKLKCKSVEESDRIKPYGACLLGAACYQLTGKTRIDFTNVFGRSEEFIHGVICSFDQEKLKIKMPNKNKQRCLEQGYKFGQEALIELRVI